MNSNGNTGCAGGMIFVVLLMVVFALLSSTNQHSSSGTSKVINTPQPKTSQSSHALSTLSQSNTSQSSHALSTLPQSNTSQSSHALSTSSQSTYLVKSGDSMSSIAAQAGVPLSALEAANPQVGAYCRIYPGETINLPATIPVTGGSVQANVDPYTVQPGDTLASLARRFHTSIDALLGDNPQITNPRLIYPGQQIIIP